MKKKTKIEVYLIWEKTNFYIWTLFPSEIVSEWYPFK